MVAHSQLTSEFYEETVIINEMRGRSRRSCSESRRSGGREEGENGQ